MDIVTQNQQTVQCEVLTDSGQTVEGSSVHSDRPNRLYIVKYRQVFYRIYNTAVDTMKQNHQTVKCEVLANCGQTLEDSSGHTETG